MSSVAEIPAVARISSSCTFGIVRRSVEGTNVVPGVGQPELADGDQDRRVDEEAEHGGGYRGEQERRTAERERRRGENGEREAREPDRRRQEHARPERSHQAEDEQERRDPERDGHAREPAPGAAG